MRQLATAGRRDFYEGAIAAGIARDVSALGGVLGSEDLRRYQARIVDPVSTEYRGAALALAPALTAGPSMRRALNGLRHERFRRNGPHADAFLAYAACCGTRTPSGSPRWAKASPRRRRPAPRTST
jgi:gamma-glutamyltranspeptidase/glutathione hydrolase